MLTPQEQERQTAEGYHHTYFHVPDLDMTALLTWPSDDELFLASKIAFSEAKQLLQAVGINAKEMVALYQPPPHQEIGEGKIIHYNHRRGLTLDDNPR